MCENTTLWSVKSSLKGQLWTLRTLNKEQEEEASSLQNTLGLSNFTAGLLLKRGITSENAASFLSPKLRNTLPDPSHLQDMDKAVQILLNAIENKECIGIFGDYDVDGATSTALLSLYFCELGLKTKEIIPDRQKDGYGPNRAAFDSFKKQGISTVVCVDCGTTALSFFETLKDLDLNVVILDHHLSDKTLPAVGALVNPNRQDQESPVQNIAAVGVVFLTLVALNRALKEKGGKVLPDLISFLDLVALGTVCDVMPLTGLNRSFVTQGLKVMNQAPRPGIKALKTISEIKTPVAAYHLGYILGPRINAGGRVGRSATGTELLISSDPQKATEYATELNHFNDRRRQKETEIIKDSLLKAQKQIEEGKKVLLIHGNGWHEGVIGIIASRLKEQYNCPALVVSFNSEDEALGKGSGRSLTPFDLGQAILKAQAQGHLESGGGHAMAAGFTVKRSKLPALSDFLEQELLQTLQEQGMTQLNPIYRVDSILTIQGATIKLLEHLKPFAPFGVGNPEPRFAFYALELVYVQERRLGTIQLRFKDEKGAFLNAVLFRGSETPIGTAFLKGKGQLFHLGGKLKEDLYNKTKEGRIQFQIEDAVNVL